MRRSQHIRFTRQAEMPLPGSCYHKMTGSAGIEPGGEMLNSIAAWPWYVQT